MALINRLGSTERNAEDEGDQSLVDDFRRKLLEEVDLQELTRLDASQRRARLERVMGLLVSREGPVMSVRARNELVRQVVNDALGLGVLEPLLADPSITEIMVNGHEKIYVERFGRLERVASSIQLRGAAVADDRPHRRGRQSPRRRVEPHGRRASAIG